MTTARVWDASVCDSFERLQNFLKSSDSIGQVVSRKEKTYSSFGMIPVHSSLSDPNLAGRWKVCQIVSAPFRWALVIALKILENPVTFVSLIAPETLAKKAVKLGKSIDHLNTLLLKGFYLFAATKVFMIKKTHNSPNQEGKTVIKTPLIPSSQIKDSRLGKNSKKGIKFNHTKGICGGITAWFAYLYLHTKNQFSDPRSHMKALGKQFAKGGGIDPTVMQTFNWQQAQLLGLDVKIAHDFSSQGGAGRIHPLQQYTPSQWESSKDVSNELQSLPSGIYTIFTHRHGMSFVKVDDYQAFFFDPNRGIIEINGHAQGEKLHEILLDTMQKMKKHGSHQKKPLSAGEEKIFILPCTLRSS